LAEQTVAVRKQAELGTLRADIIRQVETSTPAFEGWNQPYAWMESDQVCERKQLQDEILRLMTLVADLSHRPPRHARRAVGLPPLAIIGMVNAIT